MPSVYLYDPVFFFESARPLDTSRSPRPYSGVWADLLHSLEEKALKLARNAVTEQRRLISETRRFLGQLAQERYWGETDPASCSALLADQLKQHPQYLNLGVINLEGDLICSALPLKDPINVADRIYFRRTVETQDFSIGEYQIGGITGKAAVNFGYPDFDDKGRFEAVVFAALDLTIIEQAFVKAKRDEGSVYVMLDRKGTVLSRYPAPEKWVGKPFEDPSILKAIQAKQNEFKSQAIGIDDIELLYTFSALRSGGENAGFIGIGIPLQVAFAEAHRSLINNLVLIGMVSVLILAAAWFGSDLFVLRQVNALVSATKRLGSGDLNARTGPSYGEGELGQLASSFDEMAAALQKQDEERRQAEQERIQLYEQTKKQAEELEIASKVKDEFLSVMSHELRTPLNVVMGYAEMIRDGMLGEINSKQEEALRKIAVRGSDLLNTISDILYATQLEARAVVVERQLVNLSEFFDSLKSAYSLPLGKEIVLNWNLPPELPTVITDSGKLKQILQNLIDNALKFTARGQVKISARVIELSAISSQPSANSQEEPEKQDLLTQNSKLRTQNSQPAPRAYVEFKVADTGVGIPKEQLPLIFERFHQVDNSETRLFGGVGMGLYIVKQFTELLGGTIQVESEPDKGSTFTVTLPCGQ